MYYRILTTSLFGPLQSEASSARVSFAFVLPLLFCFCYPPPPPPLGLRFRERERNLGFFNLIKAWYVSLNSHCSRETRAAATKWDVTWAFFEDNNKPNYLHKIWREEKDVNLQLKITKKKDISPFRFSKKRKLDGCSHFCPMADVSLFSFDDICFVNIAESHFVVEESKKK